MKIYHGYNRLENWLIDQAMLRDYESQIAYTLGTSLPTESSSSRRSTNSNSLPEMQRYFAKRKLKQKGPMELIADDLVMTGWALIAAPFPGPYDEIIGAGMIAIGGSYLLTYESPWS